MSLHKNITRADYDAIKACNYSTLKHFDRSAAHARHEMLSPSEPSDAMTLGTALHTALLEPDRFEEKCAVSPELKLRTKKGREAAKEFAVANTGKAIIRLSDFVLISKIRTAVIANDTAKSLLNGLGTNEVGLEWTDSETGLKCKGLIDRLAPQNGHTAVVDIKTTANAQPWAFASAIAKFKYHEQAAFYLSGLNANARAVRRFIWIAIEKEPPFGVACYEPDATMLEQGELLFREHLRLWKQCEASGEWPGYATGIQELSLPKWSLKVEEV